MRILLTGASGYVGAALMPTLLADGHSVRALARSPERAHAALAAQLLHGRAGEGSDLDSTYTRRRARAPAGPDAPLRLDVVGGDVLSGDGLASAFDGVEVAYYLIHSMERATSRGVSDHQPPPNGSFAQRELQAAGNFAREATRAGVRRIVYLGGLMPTGWQASEHLASRAAVEQLLLHAIPDSLALRASIVIGARSRSFRLLVRLVERMPVLALPAWSAYRTAPIDGRDLIEMLARAADISPPRERVLDVSGTDVLTYAQMLEIISEIMLVKRASVHLPVNLTALSARLAAAIAAEDPALTSALMGSLEGDLLARAPAQEAAALFDVSLHSFEAAVENAMREWEASEPLAAR